VTDWAGSVFVANYQNVSLGSLPAHIHTLIIQVAWGSWPQLIEDDWIDQANAAGLEVAAWAWCDGVDVEAEARVHADCAQGYAAFVANCEEPYDAHGNQADPKYAMPRQYLNALEWDGPLGLTTTPLFASDMTAWQQAGAVYMPQAFPLENYCDIDEVVQHGKAWGWPVEQQRPLGQCYTTGLRRRNGRLEHRLARPRTPQRPDPAVMNTQAAEHGVGVIPYVVEQATDPDGQAWLQTMRPAIERPTTGAPPPPEPDGGEEDVTKIGKNHGITARLNLERRRYPEDSARGPGWKENDPSTWPVCERDWRREMIEWAKHDEITPEPSYIPPAP
jgi:hypothetical protein